MTASLGRCVIGDERTIDGASFATDYAYDLADNQTQITYPTGRIVSLTRDVLGRVSAVTTQESAGAPVETVATGITYEPFGPMAGWDFGNGLNTTQLFDLDYRVTDIVTGDVSTSTTVQDLGFGYAPTNNITAIANTLDATRSQSFTYDALLRLDTAAGVYGSIDYAYEWRAPGGGRRL